jgi:hypothetical protein
VLNHALHNYGLSRFDGDRLNVRVCTVRIVIESLGMTKKNGFSFHLVDKAFEIGTCHSYILFRYAPFEFHALYS